MFVHSGERLASVLRPSLAIFKWPSFRFCFCTLVDRCHLNPLKNFRTQFWQKRIGCEQNIISQLMKDTIITKVHLIWPSIIFCLLVSFLSCYCSSFGKLSSFLVYYVGPLTSATPDQLSRWRFFSGQTNTETNEVSHSVFRTYPRFAASTAGRRLWCDTNASTKEASTNLQPHKVGLYATELWHIWFTFWAPSSSY